MKPDKTTGKTTSGQAAKTKPTNLLSLCPSQGAGWCSYPFSPSQLKRRLKKKISKATEQKNEQ